MQEKRKSSLIYFLSWIGFFTIFSTTISKSPVLPLYVQALGGGETVIGLISAFSPLAGILFSFPVGMLSDKLGRKKLLLASSVILLLCPLFYLAVDSPLWLIPVRFFHGIATAILGPVASVMIVEKYASTKGEKLGLYSSSTLVGRAMAPLLGGYIISYFAQVGELTSYRYVYLAAFALAIPVFSLVLSMKEEKQSSKMPDKNFSAELRAITKNKKLMATSGVEMSIYFAYGAFETYLPTYLEQLGVSASAIGMIFSLQVLAIALSKPLFGILADRVDKRAQIVAGALLLALAIGFLGFFESFTMAVILGLIFGLGLSLATVATSTYVAEVSRSDQLGSSLGALSSIMDVGQTAGPLLTGIVISYFSYRWGFMLSLLVIAVMSLIFYVYNRNLNSAKSS